MSKENELIIQMKLHAEIEERIGRLVEIGTDLIDKLGRNVEEIEANQIRNVVAVANSAPHPAVVTNFIHYQMGRRGAPGDAWKKTGLGKEVIEVIDGEVHRLAQEVATKAGTDKASEIQARMTSLLLGFLNRSYVYKAAEFKEEKEKRKREGKK